MQMLELMSLSSLEMLRLPGPGWCPPRFYPEEQLGEMWWFSSSDRRNPGLDTRSGCIRSPRGRSNMGSNMASERSQLPQLG